MTTKKSPFKDIENARKVIIDTEFSKNFWYSEDEYGKPYLIPKKLYLSEEEWKSFVNNTWINE